MKKLISIILLSAMLFTACGKKEASVETAASETAAVTTSVEVTAAKAAEEEIQIDEEIIPQDEMGQGMLDYVLGDYIDEDTNPVLLTGERAERLEEAFRNIRINNSHFALPLMIYSLPEGFTVKYDLSSETKDKESGFNFYSGELLYDGEMCANIYIIRKDGEDEENGIICGMVVMSSYCKWSFDAVEYSNDKEQLIECLGEPSCFTDIAERLPIALYVSDIGSTVLFFEEVNSFIAVNFNFKNTLANALFVESVPYDDFDNMIEIPELSGEPRTFDFNMMFEDDCIIIGNDKYPVNVKLSDLSEDIKLFEYNIGKEPYSNKDYLNDTYLLMYKGRELAMVGTTRTKDQLPEEAYMSSWMFTEINKSPVTGSACGVSFNQNFSDVPEIYLEPDGEPPYYKYIGTTEKDGEKYRCSFLMGETFLMASVYSRSADPEAYDEFVNAQ